MNVCLPLFDYEHVSNIRVPNMLHQVGGDDDGNGSFHLHDAISGNRPEPPLITWHYNGTDVSRCRDRRYTGMMKVNVAGATEQ